MLKQILLTTLLTSTVSAVLAQAASAPAPAADASAPKKHRLHAPKLRPGATPAVNPQTTLDKKGGA